MFGSTNIEADAGTAIEHTAICQLRGRTFGPPLVKRIYLPMPITGPKMEKESRGKDMGSKQMAIELKSGDKVDTYFSVTYKKPVGEYKYGFMFEFRGADRSGHITVKYWGGQDRMCIERLFASFDTGDVVHVKGDASEYRGQVEVAVSEKNGGSLRKLSEGEFNIDDLIARLENIEELKERLARYVDEVQEPHMRMLLQSFFGNDEFMEAFSTCPASIMLHSSAFGGLLQHTLNVVEVCRLVARLHSELDRDLLLTGALLHDIGKIKGFKVTTNINQTHEGNLIGHVILGDQELMSHISQIEGFPEDLAKKLRHILLAHHGKKEWGSPVEPMMPEALAVHEADDLDAKLDYMVAKRRDAVTEDDWIWDARLGRLIYLR